MAGVKATGARRGRSAGKLMGHIRLGALPKSQKWNHVVGLIAGGANVEQIAAASANAAENGLERASDDIGLAHAFWLLTQIPLIARQADFPSRLRALGLDGLSAEPTLIEIVAAFGRAVDRYVRATGRRTDLGEMAQHAASETLASLAGRELPSLFGPTPADVQQALAKLGTAHDGWPRIGTAERLRSQQGRSLPRDRCEPSAKDWLSSSWLGGPLAMDARRRESCVDFNALRSGPTASLLSRTEWRQRMARRGGNRPHCPRALPFRRRAAVFPLPLAL